MKVQQKNRREPERETSEVEEGSESGEDDPGKKLQPKRNKIKINIYMYIYIFFYLFLAGLKFFVQKLIFCFVSPGNGCIKTREGSVSGAPLSFIFLSPLSLLPRDLFPKIKFPLFPSYNFIEQFAGVKFLLTFWGSNFVFGEKKFFFF